ncbi:MULTISPECIES: aminoacyl-tRNA deacylase [unclassified Leucobacter]|uniref:aminoacyl-tRNA deacylase n=1 Tax=unclassified Leucobacter TaxID=2621730 RepID=UPI00165E37F7|nr:MULTISPECIES: aminoacyl-tRNA deacylase [unclassified Leucobacter]MBC9928404.1 aminoacyl-tRNA deacylase [Leucobacter sp. cx-169]
MAKAQQKSPTTPATRALDQLGYPYTVHTFVHDPRVRNYGDEAIAALGVPAQRLFKTLIVQVDGRQAVAILPVPRRMQPRKVALALGAKQAELADPVVAERRTGYVLGGMSPFGQRSKLPMVVDASVLDAETVFVSGGRRGVDIELRSADLVSGCSAVVAAITMGDTDDPV